MRKIVMFNPVSGDEPKTLANPFGRFEEPQVL